jgi:hypothetical protein
VNLRNLDVPTLRAAWWTLRELRRTRRRLRRDGINDIEVPAPPAVPPHAFRGVKAILRRQEPTCLERALVLQRWLASQGDPREVIIGVRGKRMDYEAHAWVEGEPSSEEDEPWRELMRLPAR